MEAEAQFAQYFVAVCCSVLWRDTVCAVFCCSVLQCLQFVADLDDFHVDFVLAAEADFSQYSVAVCCSVLQCVAVCCSVLQCVTVCCICRRPG